MTTIRHSRHRGAAVLESVIRPLVALACVTLVALLMRATETDPPVAALAFATVVVLASLLGTSSAAVSAVASFLALNYWFIPTYGTFTLESLEDLVPLIAFALAGTVTEAVRARLTALRNRAVLNERAALEARFDAALNEARAGFLAAMTHNLRTPLASIKSAASTLRSPAVTERPEVRAALVNTVADEADRLERLVSKVLETSRIHAAALRPEREPAMVAELAGGALRRVRAITAGRTVRMTAADDDILEVEVDPEMIEVALVSILENSLRFAPPESTITVETRRRDDELCEIRIVDHGRGIPPAERERVFEEFVRLGDSSDATGAGLGLAIARAFVAAHDGRIRVEETPGGGATFVVQLPVAAVHATRESV